MLSVVREESRRSQVKSLAVAHPPPLGRPPAREIGRARRGTTGMAGSKPRGAVEKVRVPVATRIPTGSKTPGGAGTQTNKTGPVQKQRMTGNGPTDRAHHAQANPRPCLGPHTHTAAGSWAAQGSRPPAQPRTHNPCHAAVAAAALRHSPCPRRRCPCPSFGAVAAAPKEYRRVDGREVVKPGTVRVNQRP